MSKLTPEKLLVIKSVTVELIDAFKLFVELQKRQHTVIDGVRDELDELFESGKDQELIDLVTEFRKLMEEAY